MKRKLTGAAAAFGALLIASTAACGGANEGPPLGDYSSSDASGEATPASVIREWQEPCETFDFEELAQWFDYAEYRGEGKINSPYGAGTDQPAVLCQALVNFTKFENDLGHERAGDGQLLVAAIPWEDEETATSDFADRAETLRSSYDEITTESEITSGEWDESLYIQGKITGDHWDLLARDGLYMLWVRVEINSDPAQGEGPNAYTWTNEEVSSYLHDTYFEQEHQLIETALQEAGVENG
jgi:hypothetical protein